MHTHVDRERERESGDRWESKKEKEKDLLQRPPWTWRQVGVLGLRGYRRRPAQSLLDITGCPVKPLTG